MRERERKKVDRSKKAFFLIPKGRSRERGILAVPLRDVRVENSGYVKPERG